MTDIIASELKKQIFVYFIKSFDSLGIYLADSMEDARENISKDIYDGVPLDVAAEIWKDKDLIQEIELYTWDEWQNEQGFVVSNRLLEIIN